MDTNEAIAAARYGLDCIAYQAGTLANLTTAPANVIAFQVAMTLDIDAAEDRRRVMRTVEGLVKIDRVKRRVTPWSDQSGRWIPDATVAELFGPAPAA